MSQLVRKAQTSIRQAVLDAIGRGVAAGELPAEPIPEFSVEVPADRSHGDYAVNAAMVSARAFHMPPRRIAECIQSHLELSDTPAQHCEVAGAGFLNFTLGSGFYASLLADILARGDDYGRSDYGAGKKINVEFVSANPTGPMHIGNARGGALGDCLAAVLDAAGYEVIREFYVNDAGNQIEKFAASLEARYLQIYQGEEGFPFPEDGYHGADITERARQFAELEGDRYVNAPAEARRQALVDYALPRNIDGLREDLSRYRIEYDVWFRESVLHQDGELQEVIDLMKQKGLTYEKDGALWYKATEHGGEKDEVLIRANGNPTYFAADIAYHRNKLLKRGFDRAINIWGADHHGHVARLKGAMEAIGIEPSRLHIVLMQLVRLMQGGEVVRVSKRTGKSITLSTLLEEIPVDAARFIFNLREPNSHIEFDLDLAVEQSSQNPVYYVQYAHARICSILKNLKAEGIAPRTVSLEELGALSSPEERELTRHLGNFTDEIIAACENYDPARMTRYALELATLFHKFYNACRVKGSDEPLMQARLSLCLCARTVLRNLLRMLKIDTPETM